jgi:hypothetical protein
MTNAPIFAVVVEDFAKRHYIKLFEKKYKTHWGITMQAIHAELARVDEMLRMSHAETIVSSENVRIIKTQFKVVHSKESAKTSGNRCIVAWHVDEQRVHLLLVYSKTDLPGTNETASWLKLVKENYPQYRAML